MPHIVFTGGGTAGHVTPNIALLEVAQQFGWDVDYIGSIAGIEKAMISATDVPYHGISSGKLRRYFSWENFIDPFRILLGLFQSVILLLRLKPDVVFSKGGFVSVPVVVAAWLLRVPVISHESDVTPGLANRLAYPFCRKICVTFDISRDHLPAGKVIVTGTPVRQSILEGDASAGLAFLGFDSSKPVLLVFGGSLGAQTINKQVRSVLSHLCREFDVVHVAGQGQVVDSLSQPGYVQKAFVGKEFGDVLAAADLVVSRAGANSLYELFLLRKPHLLIPLGSGASRGDQLINAATFEREGYSRVVHEEALTNESFLQAVRQLAQDTVEIREQLKQFPVLDSVDLIFAEIKQSLR